MTQENQNEGILVPGEGAEIESRARESGWVSKDEFESNPNNQGKKWRPADEFLERGELFDTIKSLKNEIHSVKKDFHTLAQHHKKVAQVEYERALKDLKAQRAEAAREGDTEAVVNISEQLEELRETHQAQKVEATNNSLQNPAYTAWVQENSWYVSNPAMRGAADGIAQAYLQTNPGAPFEDLLKHITKEVKQTFSHMFKSQTKAAAVESGTNSGGSTSKKSKLTRADLLPEELDVMRTLVRRGDFTEQEYLDDLAKIKGL